MYLCTCRESALRTVTIKSPGINSLATTVGSRYRDAGRGIGRMSISLWRLVRSKRVSTKSSKFSVSIDVPLFAMEQIRPGHASKSGQV